jgi:uncharacterized protein (TIGR00255 family)
MTGFGPSEFQVDAATFSVEIRTVNHRHLDVGVRLPRGFGAFEGDVRTRIQERLSRGRVEVSVRSSSGGGGADTVAFDLDAAAAYLRAAGELAARHGVGGELDVRGLLGLPGVARVAERVLPAEAVRHALLDAVSRALEVAEAMRVAEGSALEGEIRTRIERIAELTATLEERAGEVQHAVRERLLKRMAQLREETGLFDEARLHQEIVFAADRMDVTEELVRLRSHVEHFLGILSEAGPGRPVGRRLDFLLQELGREANTVASKGSDAPIAHLIVELKTEIERVREQVQNVE